MESTSTYKCPSCSAPIFFKPEEQKFICDYCLSAYTTEEMEAHHHERIKRDLDMAERKNEQQQQRSEANQAASSQEQINEYSCQSCGAHVVTTDTTTSTFCFYCHNPVIISSRLAGDFLPDQILTFKISEEQAKQAFLDWAKTKKYLPDDFISPSHLEKMTGMYIPYWFVDTKVHVDFRGTSSSDSSYRSGDYRITTTTDKEHIRQGEYELNDVSLQAFSKIDENLLNGIEPFDGDEFQTFSMPMLQGYFAEQYTMSESEAEEPMKQAINNIAELLLQNSFPPGARVNPQHKIIEEEEHDLLFSLLPVWVLTYNYMGKIFVYAMNGQTGRAFGELPIVEDKLKRDARNRGLLMGGLLGLIIAILVSVFFIF